MGACIYDVLSVCALVESYLHQKGILILVYKYVFVKLYNFYRYPGLHFNSFMYTNEVSTWEKKTIKSYLEKQRKRWDFDFLVIVL